MMRASRTPGDNAYVRARNMVTQVTPLLTKKMLSTLVDIMILNPNIKLQDLIHRLTCGNPNIRLGSIKPGAPILIKIQSAFGYTGRVLQATFALWWANFNNAPDVWIKAIYSQLSAIIGNH
jgi:hypothetical protein